MYDLISCGRKGQALLSIREYRGPGSDLPEFKFSVEFPIGLHIILQLQIKKKKKIKTAYYLKCKIISTENPSRCNLAPLLK